MKPNTHTMFPLLLSSISALSSANAVPQVAVEKIGFSKRDDQWIGGASLYATACPSGLQNCGGTEAQNWCCPKDSVCVSDYCCPNSEKCDALVRSFPSCADPSWTLCTYQYYGNPAFFCCQSGEQCFLAAGAAPACGPGNLPVQSTQKLSTVSPLYTAGSSLGPSVSTGSSVSSQSPLSSSKSSSFSSSVLVSDSKSQVAPSITRSGSGISTSGSSATSVAAAGNSQTTAGLGSTPGPSGLSSGAIAGIIVGAIIGLALIALVGVLGVRYGSKKAIDSYAAAAAAAAGAAPASNTPEKASVYNPETASQTHETYYNPPNEHAELGADSNRR